MKNGVLRGVGLLILAAWLIASPARAAGWTDLTEEHWAYETMARAEALGVLGGLPDGTMAPEGTLSWGEYLTMLARTFYPEQYGSGERLPGTHWAFPAYEAALSAGVLCGGDFVTVNGATLGEPVTRRDAVTLALRVLEGEPLPAAEPAVADFQQLPASYQAFVARSYVLGLMTGYPDGTFRGSAVLSRAQGATLLLRTLDLSSGAVLEQETAEKDLAPAQTQTDSAQALPVELRTLGENGAKRGRLFGSAEKRRFTDQAEARTNMTEVTVPVWRLNESTGEKTAGEVTFMIHKALAADMTGIFTEIFNDPEQFPVKDIGGFRWTDGAKGEHNCGTAIDINWNENYQVYPNGTVGAGAYWRPGKDPWSIPAEGSVVRSFKAHGYSWGGDAWPTNKDYMHFSYMGV